MNSPNRPRSRIAGENLLDAGSERLRLRTESNQDEGGRVSEHEETVYLGRVRLLLAVLAGSSWLVAGGVEPKSRAADYPAHEKTAGAAIGAEFLGRYLPGEKTSHLTGNYLVVEVGFFPSVTGKAVPLSSGDFRLRLNGKLDLVAQAPSLVAGALRNPHWERERGVIAEGGIGPAVVILRPDRRQPRFPGDPESPREPPGRQQTRIEDPNAEKDAGDAAIRRALPEEPVDRPAAGMLYFAWKDPVRKLKEIALVYDGPAGKAVIRLK